MNPTWVAKHIAFGAEIDNYDALLTLGIKAVVDLRAEGQDDLSFLGSTDIDYLHLPTIDGHSPTVGQLKWGSLWVIGHAKQGRNVYIHCRYGRGRSFTLAVAVLHRYLGLSIPDAISWVFGLKPDIELTQERLDNLLLFEKQIRGRVG